MRGLPDAFITGLHRKAYPGAAFSGPEDYHTFLGALMSPHFLRGASRFLTRASLARAVTAFAIITSAACATDSAGPADPAADLASVRVSANVAGTSVNVLVVTVTGTGIANPLVFNLNVNNNFASGEVKLPAGTARLFSVQAFDSQGEITHDGSKVADVNRGQNPPVSIPLVPRNGQQPISVTMGDYSVQIQPSSKTIAVGEATQLTATVLAPNGDPVVPAVAWATSDPSIATVDIGSGMVTGRRNGTTQIIATYGGVAASMTLIVTDGTGPLTILGPVFPGPTGVTLVNYLGSTGEIAHGTAGKVFSYSDFASPRFLALGVDANNMPAVDFMSGASPDIDPSTRMTFDLSRSDPATGTLAYSGHTQLHFANGSAMLLYTRLTIRYSTAVGGVETAVPLTQADPAFASIGGWVQITSTYAGASGALHANALFEVSDGLGTWTPALDYYDSRTDKAAGTTAKTNFAGALYYAF
jgi:hypothetical protein